MKIILGILFVICVLMVWVGIGMWCIPTSVFPVLMKAIFSGLLFVPGIICGGIIIELLLEE